MTCRLKLALATLVSGLAVACSDNGVAPLAMGPTTPPLSAFTAAVTCEVTVSTATLACGRATPVATNGSVHKTSGIERDGGTLGGQGSYVLLSSSGTHYDGSSLFTSNVTLTNLLAVPMNTADGTTADAGGVKVFFYSGPTVTGGTGTVTVANPDGTGAFTGTNQPYFFYNQILPTARVSAGKTWQWTVPSTVVTFTFQVLVDASAPQEHTVLRWLYDPTGDGGANGEVWGASPSDVFVVGDGGKILHYNGASWAAQLSGTTQFLFAVWGASGSDVFAVGDTGTILHYDGKGWLAQPSGTTQSVNGVWGSTGSDGVAVGDNGTI